MKIQQIKLTNFKNFETSLFEFGDYNVFKGKNGSGKTTIRDAILFCLYNQTASGGKDTNRFIKKGATSCEVELVADEHTYLRKRSNAGSEISIDGVVVNQKDVVLPSFEIFNSVFSVGYFNSLSEKDQRNLILENTADINNLKLLLMADGDPDTIKRYELTEDDVPGSIKKSNAQKLKLSKDIDGLNYIIDYLTKLNPPKKVHTAEWEKYTAKEKSALMMHRDSLLFAKKELDQCYKVLNKIPILEMQKKCKDLTKLLKKEFKNVKLVLTEPYANEMADKDIFQFEINGLYYKNLSSGERLRFDLVISKFFNDLLENPIDLYFVDEASILDDDIRMLPQLFVAQISPYDLELVKITK